MCYEAAVGGVNGFLAVGIQEGKQELDFFTHCHDSGLSSIQLVMADSTEQRIANLVSMSSTFLYIVSVKGKTGARNMLPPGLDKEIARVRDKTTLPLVVGFGISRQDMVQRVSDTSDGAVVGSFLTDCLNNRQDYETEEEVMYHQVSCLHRGSKQVNPSYQASSYSQEPLAYLSSTLAAASHQDKSSYSRAAYRAQEYSNQGPYVPTYARSA